MKGDLVEILDWQRQPKPWFPTEESARAVVAEIMEHIKRTGRPDTWRGATHTVPPADATVIYLAQFTLPKKYIEVKRFAPCPCCSPNHQKYGEQGKVGYFPDEQVIRIIGPDCFARHNALGHREAVDRMRHEIAVRAGTQYLLDRYHLMPEVLGTVRHAHTIAEHLDRFRRQLRHAATELFQGKLWDNVRDGVLWITTTTTQHYQDRSGEHGTRTVETLATYGPLPGYRILSPGAGNIAVRLRRCIDELELIYDADIEIERMDDDFRLRTARIMRVNIQRAKDLFDEIQDLRQFLSQVSVSTLNGWGRHERAPLRLEARLHMGNFFIGPDQDNGRLIVASAELHRVLRPLPQITTDIAAE